MKKSAAFSLLEALVSITIFSLLILILLEACLVGLHFLKKTEHHQEALREASAALQLISRDLEQIITSSQTPDLVINTITRDPSCQKNFFFLTTIPCNARRSHDLGDLHAIGYFLNTAPNSTRKGLYRFMASSKATLEAISHHQLLELYQAAPSNSTTDYECIANHVSDFCVTLHSPNEEGLFSKLILEIKISITPEEASDKHKNLKNEEQTLRTIITLPPEKKVVL